MRYTRALLLHFVPELTCNNAIFAAYFRRNFTPFKTAKNVFFGIMGTPGGSIFLLILRAIMRYTRASLLHFVPELTRNNAIFAAYFRRNFTPFKTAKSVLLITVNYVKSNLFARVSFLVAGSLIPLKVHFRVFKVLNSCKHITQQTETKRRVVCSIQS